MSSNAEFIAAHRARQVGRDVTADSFAARPRRVDVPVFYLAETLGLSVERLESLRPKEWRWEHDWRELGAVVFYNHASLPALVGVLATCGETAAAARLMRFLTTRDAEITGVDVGPAKTLNASAQPWYQSEAGGMA